MGYLVYGGARHEIEDRQLAHLQIALQRSLSLHKSFFLSWFSYGTEGVLKKSLWISPYVAIDFEFTDQSSHQINEPWVAIMERMSHTPPGLALISEADAAQILERLVQEIT